MEDTAIEDHDYPGEDSVIDEHAVFLEVTNLITPFSLCHCRTLGTAVKKSEKVDFLLLPTVDWSSTTTSVVRIDKIIIAEPPSYEALPNTEKYLQFQLHRFMLSKSSV